MSAGLAQRLEAIRQRIASLECSRRVYRDCPAALARVHEQLDAAWLDLSHLERQEAEEKRP